MPVSYFFDEMPSNALSGRPMSGHGSKGFGEAGTPFEQEKDPMIRRDTIELVRAYCKIREARVRKRIFETVKAVGFEQQDAHAVRSAWPATARSSWPACRACRTS